MFNIYKILDTFKIDDLDTLVKVREDFMTDFKKYFDNMQINKTTRKNAIEKYLSFNNILKDETVRGVFSDSKSIIIINDCQKYTERENLKNCKLSEAFLTMKKTAEPVKEEELIKSDIATARALGWTWTPGASDYYIKVGEAFYDFNRFYNIYNCIADNKQLYNEGALFEQEPGNRLAPLFMRSQYGSALLLPVNIYAAHKSKIINFKCIINELNALEDQIIKSIRATA